MQILEGPTSAVDALYSRIKRDTRHTKVQILSREGDITSRRYPTFGMKMGKRSSWLEAHSEVPLWVQLSRLQAWNEERLIRLTYSSVLTPATPEAAHETIAEVLEQSIRNNPTRLIGGILLFNQKTLQLLQVLEGPVTGVRSLYRRIARDTRHTLCTLLTEEWVQGRRYEQWGMQLCAGDDIAVLPAPDWAGMQFDWESLEGGMAQSFRKRQLIDVHLLSGAHGSGTDDEPTGPLLSELCRLLSSPCFSALHSFRHSTLPTWSGSRHERRKRRGSVNISYFEPADPATNPFNEGIVRPLPLSNDDVLPPWACVLAEISRQDELECALAREMAASREASRRTVQFAMPSSEMDRSACDTQTHGEDTDRRRR